jgi:predicted GIY-YIG superfamily endonuclease
VTTHPSTGGGGTVYLLHFDRPYRHARHYCGWTADLPARLAAHVAGRGARLVEVITAADIGYRVARTWTGPRARERQIKRQDGLSRRCPLCAVAPRRPPVEPSLATEVRT